MLCFARCKSIKIALEKGASYLIFDPQETTISVYLSSGTKQNPSFSLILLTNTWQLSKNAVKERVLYSKAWHGNFSDPGRWSQRIKENKLTIHVNAFDKFVKFLIRNFVSKWFQDNSHVIDGYDTIFVVIEERKCFCKIYERHKISSNKNYRDNSSTVKCLIVHAKRVIEGRQ